MAESITKCPKNLKELKEEVLEAKDKKLKICLVGSGLSQNEQNVVGSMDFVYLKLDKMNDVIVDSSREVAVVRGNEKFREMERIANQHGLTTKVRQASGIFGILSSIATNVHGWDHKTGCIGNTVNYLKAVDSDGNDTKIERGTREFKLALGSYGFGYVFYEAEIQLTKNVRLEKKCSSFERLSDALSDFRMKSPDADLGLIWVGKDAFHSVLFSPVPSDTQGQVSQNLDKSLEGPQGSYLERLAIDISRIMSSWGLKWMLDWFKKITWESKLKKSEVLLRNECMNVRVNAIYKRFTGFFTSHKFCLVEYFVEEKDMDDLIRLVKEEFHDIFLWNISIRFVPKFTDTISPVAPNDVLSLVICWDEQLTAQAEKKSAERNSRVLRFLKKRHGTFYLPYKNNPKDIARFYPDFTDLVRSEQSPLFSNLMIEKLRQVQVKMSNKNNTIGDESDEEGDSDSGFSDSDNSETEFPSKSKKSQSQIEKTKYVEPGQFWGDMSKYTDKDFDPLVSRLNILKRISFNKRSTLKSKIFLAKLKIRNTSTLPMTYNVIASAVDKFRVSPSRDWIPPRADGVVEIRIRKSLAQDDSELRDLLKESFIVFATPIFREEHAQKAKLELYWKAFGSHYLFPYYYAENHFVKLNVSPEQGFAQGNLLNSSNFSMLDYIAMTTIPIEKNVSRDWKETSDEEFRSLWTRGGDANEHTFVTKFRRRELQRTIRRCEIKAQTPRKKSLIKIVFGFLMICLATFAMSMGNQMISK